MRSVGKVRAARNKVQLCARDEFGHGSCLGRVGERILAPTDHERGAADGGAIGKPVGSRERLLQQCKERRNRVPLQQRNNFAVTLRARMQLRNGLGPGTPHQVGIEVLGETVPLDEIPMRGPPSLFVGCSCRRRTADVDDGTHPVSEMYARPERQRCAHRVPTPHRSVDAEMIQQRNHVGALRTPPIVRRVFEPAGSAVTTGVGHQHPQRVGERLEVAQHHGGVLHRAAVDPQCWDPIRIPELTPEDLDPGGCFKRRLGHGVILRSAAVPTETAHHHDRADDPPRLGFIGLGIMGTPMCGHLVAAGYPLAVFDTDPAAIAAVVALHPTVRAATSPADVAIDADVVITMLPDGNTVRSVVDGPSGLLAGLQTGTLLLDTSSSQPWITTATAILLADQGIDMVDAPVSGAQWGAQAAELVFMVGGSNTAVARVLPILTTLGRAVHHVGPVGSGHVMKCINNTITAATFLATAEGLALGARYGLNPAAMNAVLNDSTGASWITRNHIEQRILSRTFDDPFKLALMTKDVTIANALARDAQVPLPIAALTEQLYRAASLAVGPDASLSEIARWVEQLMSCEIVANAATVATVATVPPGGATSDRQP
jgi:3-hydroxyisobutyrate dehydrogenase